MKRAERHQFAPASGNLPLPQPFVRNALLEAGYDITTMQELLMWTYSYTRGVRAARALSGSATRPGYQWLKGTESISGHTPSDFCVDHADALRDLFAQLPGEPR